MIYGRVGLTRLTERRKMRFGKNTYLVEEVIDFARNGAILVGPYRSRGVLIEADFSIALERARTQNPEDGYAIWTDLIGLTVSKVRPQLRKLADFDVLSKELPKLGDEFGVILKKRLGRSSYDEIIDEVASDLYHCAYKRAVLGDEPHFFDKLLECYRAGGWPCGWKGDYPSGQLIVYSSD